MQHCKHGLLGAYVHLVGEHLFSRPTRFTLPSAPIHCRAGLPEGASFRDWRTVPNTLMAQQLMALAAELGLAGQAATALFSKT